MPTFVKPNEDIFQTVVIHFVSKDTPSLRYDYVPITPNYIRKNCFVKNMLQGIDFSVTEGHLLANVVKEFPVFYYNRCAIKIIAVELECGWKRIKIWKYIYRVIHFYLIANGQVNFLYKGVLLILTGILSVSFVLQNLR